jgi:ABC-type glycerol-3-phosphate transport system permease component
LNASTDRVVKFIANLLLFVWIGFTLFMFGWVVVSSFKSTREIYAGVWAWPSVFRLDNYTRVLNDFGLSRFLLNSLVAIPAAPAPFTITRTSDALLETIFSALIMAAHVIIAVPC